jgi:hypothetical protein
MQRRLLAVVVAAAAVLATCLGSAAPASASAYDCYGDMTGGFEMPKPSTDRLTFGIFPGGAAGQLGPVPAAAIPEDIAKRDRAIDELRGGRPFVVHLYAGYTGTTEDAGAIAQAVEVTRHFSERDLEVEWVLRYRPATAPDVAGYVRFVKDFVHTVGAFASVVAVQITNEVTLTFTPDSSDGSYSGARDALVQGVVAAKDQARADGLHDLQVGFNWFYRLDPGTEQGFWSEIGAKGGRAFADALDWVGLDAYPGTIFTPPPLPRGDAMINALSLLRECLMPVANLPDRVAIHVVENGWPTGPGRTPAEQETAVREMVGAVNSYRANFNVTDYRWFDLRDADSASPNFQQQYGLTRDDYTPKPAFAAYRDLVALFGRLPLPPEIAPVSTPRIKLTVSPRRVRAKRRVRFTFLARVGATRLAGVRITFAGRRLRTNARGRAIVRVRLRRAVRYEARATRSGYLAGRTFVSARR